MNVTHLLIGKWLLWAITTTKSIIIKKNEIVDKRDALIARSLYDETQTENVIKDNWFDSVHLVLNFVGDK